MKLQLACYALISSVLSCREIPVKNTETSTREEKSPANGETNEASSSPEAVGDQLDPEFSKKMAAVAALMKLDERQTASLRFATERNPELLTQIFDALSDLEKANAELVASLARDFVPLSDAKKLAARILFLTGLTDDAGHPLKSIAFVDFANNDIAELIIGNFQSK